MRQSIRFGGGLVSSHRPSPLALTQRLALVTLQSESVILFNDGAWFRVGVMFHRRRPCHLLANLFLLQNFLRSLTRCLTLVCFASSFSTTARTSSGWSSFTEEMLARYCKRSTRFAFPPDSFLKSVVLGLTGCFNFLHFCSQSPSFPLTTGRTSTGWLRRMPGLVSSNPISNLLASQPVMSLTGCLNPRLRFAARLRHLF